MDTKKPSVPPHVLTPKKRRLVGEYLIDLNKTQAAIRAGYSARTAHQQATQLFADPAVIAAIQEAMDARAQRTELKADWVIDQLRELVIEARQANDRANAIRSLELLGKHFKLFTDKVEHSGHVGTEAVSTDALLDKLLRRLGRQAEVGAGSGPSTTH